MEAKSLSSVRALLGEGPVWIPEESRLYWLDIEGLALHRFMLDRKTDAPFDAYFDEYFPLKSRVGCLVPCDNTGTFLMAAQTGIEEVRIVENTGVTSFETLRCVVDPERDMPKNRYNDGKCSPEGRFWFGSLNMHRQAYQASLYVLDENGCRRILTGATNSNGLGWSPDGKTFYWIDTPTRRVEAFDYEPEHGLLARRRTIIAFPNADSNAATSEHAAWGRPDGMTVDSEGMLWIAHWMGARITRWDPVSGDLLETVPLPVSRVSSVTFGGNDLDSLFITTASKDMTEEERQKEPDAGCLFVCHPSIPGLPVNRFRRW